MDPTPDYLMVGPLSMRGGVEGGVEEEGDLDPSHSYLMLGPLSMRGGVEGGVEEEGEMDPTTIQVGPSYKAHMLLSGMCNKKYLFKK